MLLGSHVSCQGGISKAVGRAEELGVVVGVADVLDGHVDGTGDEELVGDVEEEGLEWWSG